MADISMMTKPPYPMIGEVCQLMTGAFDTKSTDASLRKKLDRLAREGDFDWSLRSRIIEELLIQPLRKFDSEFASFVESFVAFVINQHIEMLLRLALDTMSRDEAAPLLIETTYAAHVAAFLGSLRDRFDGPDLGGFFIQNANPIDVVFGWAEKSLELDVARVVFPDDKQKRDDIARWRRGDTIPDFFASIIPLVRTLREKRPNRENQIALFSKWLVTARALTWLEREMHGAGYGSLLDLVHNELLLNVPARDIGVILSIANIKAGERYSELMRCGIFLLNSWLTRTQSKGAGDLADARSEIDRFTVLTDECAPDGRTRYFLDWCEGRWLVLCGREEKALEFYVRAVNGALYRAGANQRQILEEGMALAAYLKKKSLLKRLKHRALAMGLFSGLFSELPEKSEVVSDWEVEQLAQAFGMLFPTHARFPEVPKPNIKIALPFLAFDQTVVDHIKPIEADPNRVISIPMLDGTKFRRPQLIWYASEGRSDDVRRLLNAGADVNKPDEQGGSALLNALQYAENTGQRDVLDQLLNCLHKKETLNRMTAKKRLSPLYLAILLGQPDVVARLLEMGATADQPASYPPQTPLYVCTSRFGLFHPELVKKELLQRMAFPSIESLEILRRYGGGIAGVWGRRPIIDPENPRHATLLNDALDAQIQKVTQVPRENLVEIVKLLLAHDADPNRKHAWPGPGRTPLMVAAENNAADVFRLMVDAGGNPSLRDDQGNDSLVIAREFASREVLTYLRK